MSQAREQLFAIILAAGESKRFGSLKQLANWNNHNLLQHTIHTAKTLLNENVIVVLGAHAVTIQNICTKESVKTLINRDWQQGMSTSIETGIKALPGTAEAVLILLCDQPLLGVNAVEKLLTQWQQSPELIVASQYESTIGVPAIFPARFFAQLVTLNGDKGAKQLLTLLRDEVVTVSMPEAAVDIDTRQDYETLIAQHQMN